MSRQLLDTGWIWHQVRPITQRFPWSSRSFTFESLARRLSDYSLHHIMASFVKCNCEPEHMGSKVPHTLHLSLRGEGTYWKRRRPMQAQLYLAKEDTAKVTALLAKNGIKVYDNREEKT